VTVRNELIVLLGGSDAHKCPHEDANEEDLVVGRDPQDVLQEKVRAVNSETEEAKE